MGKTSKPNTDSKKPAASAAAPKKPAASVPAKKGKALDDAALDRIAGGGGGTRRGTGG